MKFIFLHFYIINKIYWLRLVWKAPNFSHLDLLSFPLFMFRTETNSSYYISRGLVTSAKMWGHTKLARFLFFYFSEADNIRETSSSVNLGTLFHSIKSGVFRFVRLKLPCAPIPAWSEGGRGLEKCWELMTVQWTVSLRAKSCLSSAMLLAVCWTKAAQNVNKAAWICGFLCANVERKLFPTLRASEWFQWSYTKGG